MTIYTDQLNRTLDIPHPPQRIISLVPSQTELLYDLGLRDEVIGITKFCLHPEEWFRTKTRIGGTKKYDFEKIKALAPDLIIGNKEENEQQQIEALMNTYPVWMSDIYSLKDAGDMIGRLGELLGKKPAAQALQSSIEKAFNDLAEFRLQTPIAGKRVAYFIWRQPFMAVGSHTFIDQVLMHCGFTNVFSGFQRYPEVTADQLKVADPEVILLSSEPYPFKEKHVSEFQSICKDARIITVDGELFSWYGSRLLHAPPYFKKLIQTLS